VPYCIGIHYTELALYPAVALSERRIGTYLVSSSCVLPLRPVLAITYVYTAGDLSERLQDLKLHNNDLSILPRELGRLVSLTKLTTSCNPLVFPPTVSAVHR
jgi:Leucine-rich repeat (LRR) protein